MTVHTQGLSIIHHSDTATTMARRPGPPPESPEFGTFVSAPQSLLDADDEPLFDTLDRSHTPLQPSGPSKPIHVTLPPRPDEITPDYIPRRSSSGNTARSPRRRLGSFNGGIAQSPPKLTQRRLSVRSPTSPAAVDNSGRDIIFHPASSLMDLDDGSWISHETFSHEGQGEKNGHGHGHRAGNDRKAGESSTMGSTASPRSPVHSRLLDTLATTGKIASKWRQSIEHDLFDPPPAQPGSSGSSTAATSSTASAGPLPMLSGLLPSVSHSSPFASAPQLAGSYVPPSGAPGFVPQEQERRRSTAELEVAIRLNGRSASTQTVLESAHAVLVSLIMDI